VIEIVRGDATRIDELRAVFLSLRDHHHELTPDWGPVRDDEDAWGRRRRTYEAILAEGGSLHLALGGDRVVGLAICEVHPNESATWPAPDGALAIVDFALLPAARGTGAGSRPMEAVEADARERGLGMLDLMVVDANAGARRFYERHGFRPAIVNYRKRLDQ
jgi:ribosomal protein S18 acetylase RimI-like enzyme